jgi:hypothetical protein
MNATVFLIAIAVVLFVFNFFMKRRFGTLGLALAAGALLSSYWATALTSVLMGQGVALTQPQVEVLLTLLPALVLLFSGPTYGKLHMQLAGSTLFTLLALALILQPLGSLMKFDHTGMTLYLAVDEYRGAIIVVGLLVAVVDVFVGRSPHGHKSKKADH